MRKAPAGTHYDGTRGAHDQYRLPASEVGAAIQKCGCGGTGFRACKALWETLPISHQRDATIRGHFFCSVSGCCCCGTNAKTSYRHGAQALGVAADPGSGTGALLGMDSRVTFLLRTSFSRHGMSRVSRPPESPHRRQCSNSGIHHVSSGPTQPNSWCHGTASNPNHLVSLTFAQSWCQRQACEGTGPSSYRPCCGRASAGFPLQPASRRPDQEFGRKACTGNPDTGRALRFVPSESRVHLRRRPPACCNFPQHGLQFIATASSLRPWWSVSRPV